MTTPNQPYSLPPSSTAVELNRQLSSRGLERQSILDFGCATGRNTHYLGSLGHAVVGVSLELEEVAEAAANDFNTASAYIVGDIRRPMFQKPFDVVLVSEVLHMMPKEESVQALRSSRLLTKPGGLNAISGYLVTPDVSSERNRTRCLAPGELFKTYMDIGWTVLSYTESQKPVSTFKGKEIINSTAAIIAQKPR